MGRLSSVALLAAASLALGCGDDELTGPQGAVNHGGSGNQTLRVQATVGVDDASGAFLTNFQVLVSDRAGEPVSEAEVMIEGGFGPRRLTEQGTPGLYEGELAGAAWGTLGLSVERDTMFIRDVVLGNIGIHRFLTPEVRDTLPADVPLLVRWFRDSPAPFVSLSTRDASMDDLVDTGQYILPDSLNPARSEQRFDLIRYNEVQLAGGLRGSFFRMEVSTRLEPVTVE